MSFKKFDGSAWQPITPKQLKGIPYTGVLPATLTGTKAGYLHSYKIYGNLTQNGTPTPENPIVPQECGELETTGVHVGQYKLPLTSAGQDVDIYLGESQTTRRIRKLVLTGEESWSKSSRAFYSDVIDSYAKRSSKCVCSHFPYSTTNGICITLPSKMLKVFEAALPSGVTTSNDLKAYLAAQYAAGTPVTVWYILTAEETGTLNEPLRKIGNYADTIDSTQTSAQIPTTAGSTTISWAGSGLAPSEFDSIQEWVNIPTYKRVNGEWVEDN